MTDLLIQGVTVVDPSNGSLLADHDVHVHADRIVGVAPTGQLTLPLDATIVAGVGKFLVPGFVDMHAHPLSRKEPAGSLELMLAFGITGYRQMSGSTAMLKDRAALVSADFPRMLSMPGALLSPANAATAAAAVATVRQQHEQGADFIKAALVGVDAFYAAQEEAGRLDIPIVGHLPKGVDVVRASGAGMKSIEHLGPGVGLLACCSTEHSALQAAVAGRPDMKLPPVKIPFLEALLERVIQKIVINPVNMSRQPDVDILQRAVATFDEEEAGALARVLAADATWQVPTLIRSRTTYLADDRAYASDPDLRFVAPATLAAWTKATAKFSKFSPASRETFRAVYATMMALTKVFDDLGVRMLAGSDACGAAWVVPGPSLHHEFDELAKAGLAPLKILQMATSTAADFLNRSHDLGSVQAGRLADLVLLDANPIDSVEHLHKISGVVHAGRYLDATSLDSLKERVAAARSVT